MIRKNWYKFILVCLGCVGLALLITWIIESFKN